MAPGGLGASCMKELNEYVSKANKLLSQQTVHAYELLQKFVTAYEAEPSDIALCKSLLADLKLEIAYFSSCSPTATTFDWFELMIAREALEGAAIVSVRNRDTAAFERHISQLYVYYQDFDDILPKSGRQELIVGLQLLHLLASNRIGEFHMAVEAVPVKKCENSAYLRHPIQLEHDLTDGNYNRIFEAKRQVPSALYSILMEMLTDTVRIKIASCLEVSYTGIDEGFAVKMLLLENKDDLREFVRSQNAGDKYTESSTEWKLEKDRLEFVSRRPPNQEIPAMELLHNTIEYATELERIV